MGRQVPTAICSLFSGCSGDPVFEVRTEVRRLKHRGGGGGGAGVRGRGPAGRERGWRLGGAGAGSSLPLGPLPAGSPASAAANQLCGGQGGDGGTSARPDLSPWCLFSLPLCLPKPQGHVETELPGPGPGPLGPGPPPSLWGLETQSRFSPSPNACLRPRGARPAWLPSGSMRAPPELTVWVLEPGPGAGSQAAAGLCTPASRCRLRPHSGFVPPLPLATAWLSDATRSAGAGGS